MPESLLNHPSLNEVLAANSAAKRWCVALSGGPDSTVLLHLLCKWCAEHPNEAPALIAIHINHHMQADADAWQAHCQAQCSSWDVPIIVHDAVVQASGQGEEAAARQARYQLFEAEIEAGDILFMGHHLDDQVETYFLRLMRGSGLSGLSAMPAQRTLGGGQLVRPLLKIERSTLAAYASAHQLQSVQDPSNLDTSLDRNYLRQEVLPLLARRWSGYRQTVARAAEHATVSQAVMDECLPAPETVHSALGDPGIEQRTLNALSPEAAMIRLRNWLRLGALPMPDQLLLSEFIRQLREGGAASSPRLECSSYVLQRYQSRIYLLPDFPEPESCSPALELYALIPGEECDIAGVGQVSLVPLEGEGLSLHADDKLELRWRRTGERCRPRGRPYNQRLKKLFQEFSVPPWWRERVPLLYLQDELLAVGGLWLCESSRLHAQTDGSEKLWQLHWQRKPHPFD